MGYPEQVTYESKILRAGTATTALNLAASAAQWVGFAVTSPLNCLRLKFVVTTAVTASVTAPKVSIVRRPTLGSSSGAVTIETMTIPSGASVGQVYYKDVSTKLNYIVNAGEELSLEIATQAADAGTAAGAGFLVVEHENVVDQAANQSNMKAGV